LGADFVFDYRDTAVAQKIKSALGDKPLKHAFDCVGADETVLKVFETVIQKGGSVALALPPTRPLIDYHCAFVIAGVVHDLGDFEMPSFKFAAAVIRDTEGANRLKSCVRWALDEAGHRYTPPKVRKLSGKGLHDALEAFDLMKAGKISGEKVVYRMAETPGL
jgi:NADPH:quinone reductase-like Zn-dependent oxidoreductase